MSLRLPDDPLSRGASMRDGSVAERPVASGRRVWMAAGALSLAALVGGGVVALGLGGEEPQAQAARNQAAPVRIAQSERTDLPLRLEVRGELVADVAELSSQSAGHLVELSVQLGDEVSEGQVVARVEANQAEREIAQARAQALAGDASRKRARAELAQAEQELDRAERALARGLISQQEAASRRSEVEILRASLAAAEAQLAEAQARIALSRERLRDTELTAPFDGAVAEVYVDQGTMVQPGTLVVRLVKRGPLKVRFRIPERDVGRIAPGSTFELGTQATAPARHRGKVQHLAAEVSRLDRTVAVEGVLDEVFEGLRPGMYAVVDLTFGTLDDAVVVPSVALVDRVALTARDDAGEASPGAKVGGATMQTGVFVVRDGIAEFQPVSVLGSSGDQTAVEPLEPGVSVVVTGQSVLRDGAPVRVVDTGAKR